MYKSAPFSALSIKPVANNILFGQKFTRNTYILRRRYPLPKPERPGARPKLKKDHEMYGQIVKPKPEDNFDVYDVLKNTVTDPKPRISIILTKYVQGLGTKGDKVTMIGAKAYSDYILPGLAVYDTPENAEKYKSDLNNRDLPDEYSSPHSQSTMQYLSKKTLYIFMNKQQSWILEPWHLRVAFRRAGFTVPEYAITMPPEEIRGPDLSLEEKEFYVTLTVNKKEKFNVRCRIHHWERGAVHTPLIDKWWERPCEPLFPEQAETLKQMCPDSLK